MAGPFIGEPKAGLIPPSKSKKSEMQLSLFSFQKFCLILFGILNF
jgi:hypothetical protein